MGDQIAYLNIRGVFRRALMLIPLVLALAGAWFSVRWYVGDTIAEYVNADDRALEATRVAVGLAPSDPLTHWRRAEVLQSTLAPDQISQAVHEYDEAVRLSPNDYRFWLALGRALEQAGEADKGEKAMRRAVALSPSYAFPRWYLGNLLLRSGRETEAFAELRLAGEANPDFRPQIFSLAWQVYGKSPKAMGEAIGPSVLTRSEFAKYLIDNGHLEDGLRTWNDLNLKEKNDSRETGLAILKSLLEGKHFRQALDVWNDLAPDEASRTAVGQILNGGCEQNGNAASPFGWKIKSIQVAQVSFDSAVHHMGTRSVRLLFQARGKTDFAFSQLVLIQPDSQYELECFFKTRQLESAGLPIVEVIDATDGSLLGASEAPLGGNSEWQPSSITFKTGPKAEAIVIRINRASCGDSPVCGIFGTMWYDDFSLKRK